MTIAFTNSYRNIILSSRFSNEHFQFQELDILRSFFLLARGELFQEFIEEADTFLNKPPNAATGKSFSEALILESSNPRYDNVLCMFGDVRRL